MCTWPQPRTDGKTSSGSGPLVLRSWCPLVSQSFQQRPLLLPPPMLAGASVHASWRILLLTTPILSAPCERCCGEAVLALTSVLLIAAERENRCDTSHQNAHLLRLKNQCACCHCRSPVFASSKFPIASRGEAAISVADLDKINPNRPSK